MQVVADEYWLHMKMPLGKAVHLVLSVLRNDPWPQTKHTSEVAEKVTHWLGLLFLIKQVWLVVEYQKPVLHSRHPKVLSVILELAWSKVLQFVI